MTLLAVLSVLSVAPISTAGAGSGTTAPTTAAADPDTSAPAGTVAPVVPSVLTIPPPTGPAPTAPSPTAPAPNLLESEDDDIDSGPPAFLVVGLVLSLATAAVIGVILLVLQRRSSRSTSGSDKKP